MQQRYCECGYLVWVAYVITGQGIKHWYKIQAKMNNTLCCPGCGRQINIHDLR